MKTGIKYCWVLLSDSLHVICFFLYFAASGTAYGNGFGDSQHASKSQLEILFDNKAKQTINLDQPSTNITTMTFKSVSDAAVTQKSRTVVLTKGWDIFDRSLSSGQAGWMVTAGQNSGNLNVAYKLQGAEPNHEYTVGVHLFNPENQTVRPVMTGFGGWDVKGEGVYSRDGRSAYSIAYDFGALKTDARGNGSARFDLAVPPGNYYVQFTVRVGAVNTCRPAQGVYHGCSIVYRSGGRFGEGLESIKITDTPQEDQNDLFRSFTK